MARITEGRPAVCIVRHNYYPDTHVRRDAEALAQAGYDVSVIALRRPEQPAREVLGNVSVYRLPVQHIRGDNLRYAFEYAAFAVLAFFSVALLHLRKRFKVVEVDNMPDALVISSLVPKLCGAKILLYIFDNMPEVLMVARGVGRRHLLVRLLTLIERASTAFADRVIVSQETARQLLLSRGTPAWKVKTVLNSADEAIFTPPQTAHRPTNHATFTIVTHGVILERYGIQVLLDALPIVKCDLPGIRVQIFGTGEYRADLEERARRNGVTECVQFRGFVSLDELLSTIVEAHAGYVGMLCNNMLSNKLVEYVSLGVPVLLARWPTFEHYFPDDTVNYFAAGSSQDLATAMLAIHRDPDDAQARSERAQALYRSSYAWRIQRDVYLGVYGDLRREMDRERAHDLAARRASW